jgi:hypothetical protein
MKNDLTLKEIDNLFSTTLKDLDKIISQHHFVEASQVTLSEQLDLKIFDEVNFPGLYLFEIKNGRSETFGNWFDEFKDIWHHKDYLKRFVPNTKIKRTSRYERDQIYNWIPLYIGKSRNVSRRIKEHFSLGLDRNTTAMKLLSRTNLFSNTFRISTMKIETVNYDLILPQFEKAFRDVKNPILGRQ